MDGRDESRTDIAEQLRSFVFCSQHHRRRSSCCEIHRTSQQHKHC